MMDAAATPIVFVAGFGRCGTTMMMTMIDRGGFPVAGPPPAYEVREMIPRGKVDIDWLRSQAGRAVKWIDPINARISRNSLPCQPIILHMDRDTKEMARSQVKMLAWFGEGIIGPRRRAVRAFAKSIARDKPTLTARLNALGIVYSFTFEWVLAEPETAARKLGAIIRAETGCGFDVRAASAVPKARSPLCAPDLSLEMGL